ncbi:hypothetical protein [Bacillus suaedae]|uniref:YqgU-like 6-bladed beta-propeller domain-containing protein n=1 Tax=Halalkalibacter suaedae TaxID=2822140 RepID=A0A940WT12_9BACI|nr:hypothetical protein [Bacillus suaedae]MBP3951233.1 hypothetical protein [Bacillus suaedae]
MRYIFFYMIVLFVLTACSTAEPLEVTPSPLTKKEKSEKVEVPESFVEASAIIPLQKRSPSFIEVVGWVNDETILYLEENEQGSKLMTYELYTTQSSVFFETDDWIIDTQTNEDSTLFAIQTLSETEGAKLTIVNQLGEEKLVIRDLGEEYSVFWNPYNINTFVLVAFLPDWQFTSYVVDVTEGSIDEIDLEQSYMQWVDDTKVAYLKWDEIEPTYFAPLFELDIETGEKSIWKDDVIAYMSFSEGLSLTVTVDRPDALYSSYTFYKDQESFREIEMPILNTYSEQWWVPYYTYDKQLNLFYYMRPKYSSDFFSYTDGYELIAYNVEEDSEKKLATFERNLPLKISPSGKAILLGEQFEQVYDVNKGSIINLLGE